VIAVDELVRPILEQAERDETALGVVLFGSHAAGRGDEESDVDLLYVRREGAEGKERRGPLELASTTLRQIRAPVDWFKPALAHGRVLLDKTGEIADALEAAARVTREETAELYDSYLNDFYRSLKAWRRGNELAGRVEAGRSLRFLGELLFALDGRRAPYPSDWAGRLGELEPLILDVARTAAPAQQQELQARVEALASARGFRDVYDAWEGEIDRVMALRFPSV
jgi:predicted nucleotidyltransferase